MQNMGQCDPDLENNRDVTLNIKNSITTGQSILNEPQRTGGVDYISFQLREMPNQNCPL